MASFHPESEAENLDMRCFVAIETNSALQDRLGKLATDIRRRAGVPPLNAKWVDPSLIHLTLKFLGEVRDNYLTAVCEGIEQIAARHEPFSLDVQGIDTFGKPARVLWVGMAPEPALQRLQADLETRLAELGFSPEPRPYTGHLTLCRIRNRRSGQRLEAVLAEYPQPTLGPLDVKDICLFKSELTKTGPLYTILARYPLGHP